MSDPDKYPRRIFLDVEQAERLGAHQRQVIAWRAERRALPVALQLGLAAGAAVGMTGLLPLAPAPLVIGAVVILVLRLVRT